MQSRPGAVGALSIVALFLLLPLTFSVQAQPVIPEDASPAFGAAGAPVFNQYQPPEGTSGAGSGEPTIGIPWNTDSVFYQSGTTTFRLRFPADSWNGSGAATVDWVDVTPPNSITNVDPMLHADPELGRVWAGGLAGPCSIMSFSDDDGETWVPTGNMCSGAQFDHQSIGSGPPAVLPGNPTFPHMTYYCAQLGYTACAASVDGGLSWGPINEVLGACGGLHGHIRVSRVTGTAVVPHKSCGGEVGFGYTETDGALWMSRTVPGSSSEAAFDPSIQFTRDSGWLYMAQADYNGVHVALSKDDGAGWEELGGGQTDATGNQTDPSTWLDIGRFHDPPIKHAHFADVQAGDDDRVAVSFLGLEDRGIDYGSSSQLGDCGSDGQADRVWHYYVALSYDAGMTWDVQRVSPDPVQLGSVFTGGFSPGDDSSCRNLLDFNDMDMDSTGRIHVAVADGCIRECAQNGGPDSDGYRANHATILRQETGRGLFSAFDNNETQDPVPGDEEDETGASEESPAVPLLIIAAALVGLAARRRD